MASRQSSFDKFLQFFSSLKCGLLLLGMLGMSMILGTFILQRPMAQEGQIEQVYAPQVVRLLNAVGLFDVFHAWWFMLLLGLLGANIALASIERFPQVWRLFVRPHYAADSAFMRALPFQREIPLGPHTPQEGSALAALKLENLGYPPRPDILSQGTLYVEKHRLVRLAPYMVHASLLIIFAGAIMDGDARLSRICQPPTGESTRCRRTSEHAGRSTISISPCVAMPRAWTPTLTAPPGNTGASWRYWKTAGKWNGRKFTSTILLLIRACGFSRPCTAPRGRPAS